MLTLGTLSLFRWFESRIPTQRYSHFIVRFTRAGTVTEPDLRKMVTGFDFTIANMHYTLADEGKFFEYRMVLCTLNLDNVRRLSEALSRNPAVAEFRIFPASD